MSKKIKLFFNINQLDQYILLCLTIISGFLAVLYWQKDTLAVYDASGHLAAVEAARENWPAVSFWNSRELLGWPQGVFYPPLFHWLAAGLSFLVGTTTAVKLLITAALLIMPFSILAFAKSLTKDKYWATVIMLALVGLVLFLPDFLGSNIRGLYHVGLLPSFFVLPLVFLFLSSLNSVGSRSSLGSGLLLAFLLLTHLVAGIIGLAYLSALFIAKLLFGKKHSLKFLILTAAVAGLLTPFFWIPFLVNHAYTSVATHGIVTSYLLPNLVVATASAALLIFAFSTRKENIFVFSLISGSISAVAVADAILFKKFGTSFVLEALNIYRFQTFAYLFFICALLTFIAEQKWVEKFKRLANGASFFTLVLIVLLLLVKNPSAYQEAKVTLEDRKENPGRFLENFRRLESFPAVYELQNQLKRENPESTWAYGVFVESSFNAPFVQSLIKSLRPQAYPEGEGALLETKFVDPQRTGQLLELFGINYLINLEGTKKETVATWVKGAETKYYNLEKVSETPLFEVLKLPPEPIEKDWDKKVEGWWLEKGPITKLPYLVKGDKLPTVSLEELVKAKVEVVRADEQQNHFELNVISEGKVPILAKISYFPYWRAFDKDSKEIPIYRAAPNLMLISANGKVTLEYKEPVWVRTLYIVAAATFVICIFALVKKK